MNRIEKLFEYVIPKLQRSDVDVTTKGNELPAPVFNFMTLEDEPE